MRRTLTRLFLSIIAVVIPIEVLALRGFGFRTCSASEIFWQDFYTSILPVIKLVIPGIFAVCAFLLFLLLPVYGIWTMYRTSSASVSRLARGSIYVWIFMALLGVLWIYFEQHLNFDFFLFFILFYFYSIVITVRILPPFAGEYRKVFRRLAVISAVGFLSLFLWGAVEYFQQPGGGYGCERYPDKVTPPPLNSDIF